MGALLPCGHNYLLDLLLRLSYFHTLGGCVDTKNAYSLKKPFEAFNSKYSANHDSGLFGIGLTLGPSMGPEEARLGSRTPSLGRSEVFERG